MASGAMSSWLGICRHATCTPQLRDGRVYLFGSLFKVLVLPEACDVPSRLLESFIGVPVASLVSLDLCSPVGGVLLWPGPMDRATMPEAAVDEDRHTFPGENDIDLSANTGENASLHAVPESASMQRRSEMHLRLRSSLPSGAHPRPCGCGRCLGRVWIGHGGSLRLVRLFGLRRAVRRFLDASENEQRSSPPESLAAVWRKLVEVSWPGH